MLTAQTIFIYLFIYLFIYIYLLLVVSLTTLLRARIAGYTVK